MMRRRRGEFHESGGGGREDLLPQECEWDVADTAVYRCVVGGRAGLDCA